MENIETDIASFSAETQSRISRFELVFINHINQLYANGRHQLRIDIEVIKEVRTHNAITNQWGVWIREDLSEAEKNSLSIVSNQNLNILAQGWRFTRTNEGFHPGLLGHTFAQTDAENIADAGQQMVHPVNNNPEIFSLFLTSTSVSNQRLWGRIQFDHPREGGQISDVTRNDVTALAIWPLSIPSHLLTRQDTTLIDQQVPWASSSKHDWWTVMVSYFRFPQGSAAMRSRRIYPEAGANNGNGRHYPVFLADGNHVRGVLLPRAQPPSRILDTVRIRQGTRQNVQQGNRRTFNLADADIMLWGEFDNYSGFISSNRVTNGNVLIVFMDHFGNEYRYRAVLTGNIADRYHGVRIVNG